MYVLLVVSHLSLIIYECRLYWKGELVRKLFRDEKSEAEDLKQIVRLTIAEYLSTLDHKTLHPEHARSLPTDGESDALLRLMRCVIVDLLAPTLPRLWYIDDLPLPLSEMPVLWLASIAPGRL
jgi:hypothetical protein